MTRFTSLRAALLVAAIALVPGPSRAAKPTGATSLSFGAFGRLTLYRERPHPSHVVLFASGDGGWNLGVVDMARALAAKDALVVGFSTPHYLRRLEHAGRRCAFPSADLQALGQFVERSLGFPAYVEPVLVGYSSGATLGYAALVQAPPGTFRGAIGLGFCPELQVKRPFCRGQELESTPITHPEKGFRFAPDPGLQVPWISLQGQEDRVCDPAASRAFAARIPGARFVLLPKVGHGYSVQRHWMPQFLQAFTDLTAPAPPTLPQAAGGEALADVSDLPLVEVPARKGSSSDLLAIVLSGDGGWASLDREVAGALAARGVPAVGLDSLRYLWTRRTPAEAADALTRVAHHFLARTGARRLLLVGYSLGADILPFMASRLPADLRSRVAVVALLAPGTHVEFEFHVANWLGSEPGKDALPTAPEVARLAPLRVLCVYGATEKGSLCPTLPPGGAIIDVRPDGHHLGGDYVALAKRILAAAAEPARASAPKR